MSVDSETGGLDSAAFGAAFGVSPFPVVVVDGAGTVIDANPAATRALPGMRTALPLGDWAPDWLAAAHEAGAVEATGPVGARQLQARTSLWPGGRTAWWLTDRTESADLERELAEERDRTAFLIEASNELLSSLNVQRALATTAALAVRHLAEAAVVVAPPAGRRLSATRALRGGRPEPLTLPVDPAEVPGLVEALQGFPPVPSRWIDPALAPAWLVPESMTGLGALIVTPLPGNGVPAGALILLRSREHGRFTEAEEALARLFAARAGAAISAALLFARQSSVARVLTDDLAPPSLTRHDGLELAGGYRPAGDDERVGGDFYDVHHPTANDPDMLVVLGDVCGKGLEAAVLTGKIRTSIHALRTVESDHLSMLRLLNGALLSARHTRFATLVLASVRRVGDRVAVRATCGGHPPPLVVRADGAVEQLETRGTLIGALESVRATSAETLLNPGETCLLYSDGITEARGGFTGQERFGSARLAEALGECAGLPAEAVVERIQMVVDMWSASNPRDDVAVVAVTAPLIPVAARAADPVGAAAASASD